MTNHINAYKRIFWLFFNVLHILAFSRSKCIAGPNYIEAKEANASGRELFYFNGIKRQSIVYSINSEKKDRTTVRTLHINKKKQEGS